MLHHDFPCFSFLVFTIAAGTERVSRSLSFLKCMVQEFLGLIHPFMGDLSLTWASHVHPLTVLHPLAYTHNGAISYTHNGVI